MDFAMRTTIRAGISAGILALLLLGMRALPAAAQQMQVDERPSATIRMIAGSPSTGHWAPGHATAARDRGAVERGLEPVVLRLCQQQAQGATDCTILTTFGPGSSCGTVASAPGYITAGVGPTPEAARAAALATCQANGRRCTPAPRIMCYR
jgi:hypothetical protein